MTLEELLQKYFNLKGNLYLKKPKVIGLYADGEQDIQKATDKGEESYAKLISFLEDLPKITDIKIIDDVNDIIDDLDRILDIEEV